MHGDHDTVVPAESARHFVERLRAPFARDDLIRHAICLNEPLLVDLKQVQELTDYFLLITYCSWRGKCIQEFPGNYHAPIGVFPHYLNSNEDVRLII